MGYRRNEPDQGEKAVKLLYFSWLAKKMRKEAEEVTVPAVVTDVDGLLRWLAGRRRGAGPLFEPGRLRVTVNKQFTEGFTKLHAGDEVGLVPTAPTPPPTPDLI
jgi:molybdopterin converting factor small subunit